MDSIMTLTLEIVSLLALVSIELVLLVSVVLLVFNFLLSVMKKIGELILRYPKLVKILSFSPILNFSSPSNFGEILVQDNELKQSDINYSLLNLKLGTIYISLLTRKVNDDSMEWRMYNIVNLKNIQNLPDYTKIDKVYDEYETFLKSSTQQNINSYKEILSVYKDKIESKMSYIDNKINFYMAITAIVVPLHASLFSNESTDSVVRPFFFVLLLILCYQYLNLVILLYEYMKVKAGREIILKNLLTSNKPDVDGLLMLYYHYMVQRDRSVFNVSLLKNIEKYIVFIFLTSLLIFFVK